MAPCRECHRSRCWFLVLTAAAAAAEEAGNGSAVCKVVEGVRWRAKNGLPQAKFSGVMIGQTGSGKSTAIDILAGGNEYSKIGSVGGESETEGVCSYWFTYSDNRDPAAKNETWRLTDTPGFHDTKGEGKDITNQEVVAEQLRGLGSADAVVVVFKSIEKLTEEMMSTFGFVRSYFGPGAWRNMILYYSFFSWQGICFGETCQCTRMANLTSLHESVMAKAFDYLTVTLGTGDVRCNKSVVQDCFPDAATIPYIGSDLYMEKVKLGKEQGCDMFDPDASCYMNCNPNGAEETRRFHRVAMNLTHSPSFVPLNLSAISNTWVDCQKALAEIRAKKSSRGPYDMRNGTQHTSLCYRGGMRSQVEMIRNELLGNLEVQGSMAWLMEPSSYLKPEYGFDLVTATDVEKYPEIATNKTCWAAMQAPPSSMVSKLQSDCWSALQHAPHPPPSVQEAKDELLAVVRCRCDGLNYTCSLTAEDGGCHGGAGCSLDGDWALADTATVCKGTCGDYKCYWPDTVLKRAVEQPRFCQGQACTTEECCTSSTDVCSEYSGQDTGGTCGWVHCWNWRGPTFCDKHSECLCKHGYCAREGKCYGADTIRFCDSVDVPCGAANSVAVTNTGGFWTGECVCDDGYCAMDRKCVATSELVRRCKADPQGHGCARVDEVLGLARTSDLLTQGASDAFDPPLAYLFAGLFGGTALAGGARVWLRRWRRRESLGEALLSSTC